MRRGWSMGWLALASWLGVAVLVGLGYVAWIALLVRLRYPNAIWACELVGLC